MHHPDHEAYIRFTGRQRIDKAVHTLEGILKGIGIDGKVVPDECRELANWCEGQSEHLSQHPFNEIVPQIRAGLADGILSPEEHLDLLWLCRQFTAENKFYDQVTTEIQVLHGMLQGILSDGVITVEEAKALSDWTDENSHLKGIYPFDELDSLLTSVLKDGRIDDQEQVLLRDFFENFISYSLSRCIQQARKKVSAKAEMRLPGVCAVCPEIDFPDRLFCCTGASTRAVRQDMVKEVVARRGLHSERISEHLNYLIVGSAGNPCWAFSCYGRKVEKAVELRKSGHRLLIVHENDFWDAIQDVPVP
jgi:hypothetical protein